MSHKLVFYRYLFACTCFVFLFKIAVNGQEGIPFVKAILLSESKIIVKQINRKGWTNQPFLFFRTTFYSDNLRVKALLKIIGFFIFAVILIIILVHTIPVNLCCLPPTNPFARINRLDRDWITWIHTRKPSAVAVVVCVLMGAGTILLTGCGVGITGTSV